MATGEDAASSGLRHGDHVCVFFETRDEQIRAAIDYIREGLAAGERCIYIGDQRPERVRQTMWELGIDVDGAERQGALVILSGKDVYLPEGRFDADRTLKMLEQAIEDVAARQFAGLRTAGDMTWLSDEPAGADQALRYEALINQTIAKARGICLCFYHRRRTPAKILDLAITTHPLVVLGRELRLNQFYLAPALACTRTTYEGDADWKLRELER